MTQEALKRLVKREEDLLDAELLASVLEGLVFVDPDREKVLFTPGGMALKARKRVMLFLLARKALRALGGKDVAEEARPKDIEGPTDLKGGTVRPKLKQLCDEGIVAQGENGYYVPVYKLEAAARVITEE